MSTDQRVEYFFTAASPRSVSQDPQIRDEAKCSDLGAAIHGSLRASVSVEDGRFQVTPDFLPVLFHFLSSCSSQCSAAVNASRPHKSTKHTLSTAPNPAATPPSSLWSPFVRSR